MGRLLVSVAIAVAVMFSVTGCGEDEIGSETIAPLKNYTDQVDQAEEAKDLLNDHAEQMNQ